MYLVIIFVWYIGCLLVYLRARGRVYPPSGYLGLGIVVLGSIAGLIIFPNSIDTLLGIIGYNVILGNPIDFRYFSNVNVQTGFGIIVGWLVSAVVLGLWFFSDRPVFGRNTVVGKLGMSDDPVKAIWSFVRRSLVGVQTGMVKDGGKDKSQQTAEKHKDAGRVRRNQFDGLGDDF